MRSALTAVILVSLAGCAELNQTRDGSTEVVDTTVQSLGGDRFAVSVNALNTDGYLLARCVAAEFVNQQRDSDGNLLFPVYRRDGGKLTDEFRLKDGVRTQTTTGIQTYEMLTEGDHDGRDVMAVALQLATCEQAGLPLKE